jgi:hypothetical protein
VNSKKPASLESITVASQSRTAASPGLHTSTGVMVATLALSWHWRERRLPAGRGAVPFGATSSAECTASYRVIQAPARPAIVRWWLML